MSYDKNLGRVKGDTGTTYIPSITIENNKQYISFTSSDGTPVPASLQKREFASYVYVPAYDESTGILSFTLQTGVDSSVVAGNVKGPKGDSTIRIESCTYNELPANPTAIQKGTIYVITDTDDTYLDAVIYSETKGDYVYLENKIRFDNYYTKQETYNKTELYNKEEIAGQLGTIVEQQNAIVRILGDTGAIIILDDE